MQFEAKLWKHWKHYFYLLFVQSLVTEGLPFYYTVIFTGLYDKINL